MKILHIAYFGRQGTITGIVESVMNISQKQREIGHDVIVMIPFNHPLVDNKNVFYSCSFWQAIARIKGFSPHIVVFDGFYDKYQIRFSWYLKWCGIPYVVVFHGGESADNMKKNWLKKRIANCLFFNRFVKWAKSVIYLSENEKNKSVFSKINPNYNIIPNGVNIPININPKEAKSDKISFLYLSRLDWHGKGLDVFCDALKLLFDAGYESKVCFEFYGTKESIETEKLFQFGNMTKYEGYVTGKEKEAAYRNADIFILPSRSEGMPMVVLEALSFGLPCIVTPETNMATLIEENKCGWVVNLSPQDVSNIIKEAAEDYLINQDNYYYNSVKAAQLFDWSIIAEKSISVYKRILNYE